MSRKLSRTPLPTEDDSRFQELVAEVAESAPRQYAQWNSETFAEFCRDAGRNYWNQLAPSGCSPVDREKIARAFLEVLKEAVGTSLVSGGRGKESTFLGYCLERLVPRELHIRKPREQVQILADLRNLAEGLAGEPNWVGYYVASRLDELQSLSRMKAFLVEVLDPVLTPGKPSAWKGPFQHTIMDLSQVDEDFLPGEMSLVAPHVLCVTDRLRSTRLGILLRKNRTSRIIGPLSAVAAYNESWEAPILRWEPNAARVNDQLIPFPYLNGRHASVITRGGFLVATAVDTQRLWIVESV